MRIRNIIGSIVASAAFGGMLFAAAPASPAGAEPQRPSQLVCQDIVNVFVAEIENVPLAHPSDPQVQVLLRTGERVLDAAGCPSGYSAQLLEAASGGSGGGTPA